MVNKKERQKEKKKKKGSEGERKEGRGEEGNVTEEENLKSCVWLAGGLTSVSEEQLQSASRSWVGHYCQFSLLSANIQLASPSHSFGEGLSRQIKDCLILF